MMNGDTQCSGLKRWRAVTGPNSHEEPAWKDRKRRTAVALRGLCDGGRSEGTEEERAPHSGAAGGRYRVPQSKGLSFSCSEGSQNGRLLLHRPRRQAACGGGLGVTPRPVDHGHSAGPLQ